MTARTKTRYVRSNSIRKAAQGMPCAWCGKNDGTTVWAHSNRQADGKGMAIKASDSAGAFLCGGSKGCHAWLDSGPAPAEEKEAMFAEAQGRSAAWWAAKNIRNSTQSTGVHP